MQILGLTLGDYQTNCYIVYDDDKNAVVIDPGYSPEIILKKIRENQLNLQAILLTHCHFDHVGGVKGLYEAIRCPVWINEKDLKLPSIMTNGNIFYTDSYEEGSKIMYGALEFTVLETPGHTPGSVCLQIDDVLFTGDTLFRSSCGRTDFPGGSKKDMKKSLERLAAITGNFYVLPGHGQTTTLEIERSTNMFFEVV